MEHRQNKLPYLHMGGTHLHSPNLSQCTNFDCQSAKSACSTDSFCTQVPLPYYLPNDGEPQEPNTTPQIRSPWATPDLPGSPVMASFQGLSKSLNPASTPYVPSGYLPQPPAVTQGLQAPFQHDIYGGHDFIAPSSSFMQPSQQGSQSGKIMSSQYDNPFVPKTNMLGGLVGCGAPGQFQHHQHSNANHYGQLATIVASYPTYNSGPHVANATSATSFSPMYPSMNTGQNFERMAYPPAIGASGASQSWNPSFSGLNMDSDQGMLSTGTSYNVRDKGSSSEIGPNETYNTSNQGSSHTNSQETASASRQSRQSNLRGGQALGYKGKSSGKKFGIEDEAHVPTAKTAQVVRTPSPNRSAAKTGSHSKSRNHRYMEVEDTKSKFDLPVTPGSRPHPLGLEFSSEPRKSETPLLRSRGYTTSSTDPSHKNVFNWLESTPTLEGLTSRDKSDDRRRASPPKMMSLLAAGSITASNLKTIDENDPFNCTPSSLPGSQHPIDSFAATKIIVPYSNAVGIARNNKMGMSAHLRSLTGNGTRRPTIAEALDSKNLPFAEYCRLAKEDCWGVIKIKNIPYSVNRPEVLAFLGRNAKIVAEHDNEPIHIIMERVTSKTLDCYVEFISFNEAVAAVNRFETNRTGGRSGRLGQRHVDVELSSQEHLMRDLFPKAKNVQWHGSRPTIIPKDPKDIYNSGFQGFVSREELVMLVKHVESPQRSPFSKDCPQRPFECLISTLLKYPWQMVDYITIEDRNMLHKATLDMLNLLIDRVNTNKDDICLTPMLLKRVWKAGLRCPGFTPSMKDDIVFICQIDDQTAMDYGVAPYASFWKYLWTIGPKPGVPIDVLLWYIAIIRETTNKHEPSLAEKAAIGEMRDELKLFGDLDKHLRFPRHLAQMKLAEVAKMEWTVIEMILRLALGT